VVSLIECSVKHERNTSEGVPNHFIKNCVCSFL